MVQDTRKVRPSRTVMLSRMVPPTRYGKWAGLMSCGVMLAFVFPGILLFFLMEVAAAMYARPLLAVFSAACAIIFAIPHFFVILWLDRNEREPIYLILTAFFWGAVMATTVSGLFNASAAMYVHQTMQDAALAQQLTASVFAPFIEEFTKGLALLFIYLFFTKEMDNVVDGIVYGALVGLGFAVFENFTYYFSAGSGQADVATAFAQTGIVVYIRGIVTGLGSHISFTAMTGAGFGLFRVLRKGWLRWLIPPSLLVLAMFAHFTWNTFTGFFQFSPDDIGVTLFISFPLAVVVLQLPFLLMVLTTVAIALRHEEKLIMKYLRDERTSIVSLKEREQLVPARRRTINTARLLFRLQLRKWWRRRKRNQLLIALAFERWHMDKEDLIDDQEAAHYHALRVTDLRRQIKAHPIEE